MYRVQNKKRCKRNKKRYKGELRLRASAEHCKGSGSCVWVKVNVRVGIRGVTVPASTCLGRT